VGTFASLREVTALPDGRFDIVAVGTHRFRVLDLVDGLPYAQARVEWLEEEPGDASIPLARSVAARFQEYRDLLTDEPEDTELPDDARVLSYLVGAAVVADLGTRQGFLEATDDSTRLRDELTFLRRETALIQHVPSLPAVDLAREPFGVC
jgi:Lon protease-like protein